MSPISNPSLADWRTTLLKTIMLTAATVALLATTSMADDDLLAELSSVDFDVSSFVDADIAIEDDLLDGFDVDTLASEAGTDGEDAIEACFRRCGYGGFGRGYGGYGYGFGYGGYNNCHHHCYQPCYQQYYCHRPVYTYSYCPTYSYWGCY